MQERNMFHQENINFYALLVPATSIKLPKPMRLRCVYTWQSGLWFNWHWAGFLLLPYRIRVQGKVAKNKSLFYSTIPAPLIFFCLLGIPINSWLMSAASPDNCLSPDWWISCVFASSFGKQKQCLMHLKKSRIFKSFPSTFQLFWILL